jgi:hypothetical protein
MIITSITDMMLGMVIGMVASPLLMKLIKSFQQRRKVNRFLKDAAANMQRTHIEGDHGILKG